MSLTSGTQLGIYEILSAIGAGGMGEVYRARDTKLGREVAIKVLPDTFAQNPERLARFKREAKLLASLNHTNIATIHGLEESGGTHYLVMEMVPGDTLAERIQHDGAVPIEEALGICTQIAEALEHAHEKGVIHRDLKPANVKVTPEGKVKVLDFGLAKAFAEPSASDVVDSQSPTLMTASPTMPGVILGTAAYMSPEQAKGKAIDKRTDIWAFGCVLYELLTGKMVFAGENVQEIIAGILKGEPEWDALPDNTPRGIRALLRRCLQKEARHRLRDAGDLRIQIEDSRNAPTTPIPSRTGWRRALPVVLASLVVGVIVGIAVWNLKPSTPPTPLPPVRFGINIPGTDQLLADGLALSPDGANLVYVARRGGGSQLYRRSMDQLDAVPIPGTEGAELPFFSPDGQWVGFFAANSTLLKKVSLAGGPPVTLSDALGFRRGASWGQDDTIVFAIDESGLLQVSADGGVPEPVTILDSDRGELNHRFLDILPGSKAVLFTVWTGSLETSRIAVQSLETGERRILVDGANPRFAPTGHLVFARTGSLWAVPFDADRLEMTGSPVPVLEGVQVRPGGFAQFALAADGSLVYIPVRVDSERTLVWVDRQGAVEPLAAPPRAYVHPKLSPDGQRLAVHIGEVNSDVWVYDISRETLTRLTFEANNRWPIWTPDGKRLTFISTRAGLRNLFWKPADGSGTAEQLTTSEYPQYAASWSPDGRVLAFTEIRPTGFDIWVLPLEGERKPRPFLQTPARETVAIFSPDGRWLAYVSDESGRNEIYVQPYPGPGEKWLISTDGGNSPVWNPNGQELFYRNGDQMMAVEITTEPTFSAGIPRLLFEGRYFWEETDRAVYDVTPDGQRFVMIQEGEQDSAPPQINVVLNWFEELKQRVPTGN